MITKNEYWEQVIAVVAMVFAIYPFTKDYLNEPSKSYIYNSISPFITLSMLAYFLAIFLATLTFVAILSVFHFLKKQDDNELKKMERI